VRTLERRLENIKENISKNITLVRTLERRLENIKENISKNIRENIREKIRVNIRFLISNFRRGLYVVRFLLGNSPASEFYVLTFRNSLSVPSCLWRWNRQCSETSAYKIQTPRNYSEENIKQNIRWLRKLPCKGS
jgi:hypothetical protein